jgi:hypothetical protein
MSILLDLKIILKTGVAIAGQLFESQHAAQRSQQGKSRRSTDDNDFTSLKESAGKI